MILTEQWKHLSRNLSRRWFPTLTRVRTQTSALFMKVKFWYRTPAAPNLQGTRRASNSVTLFKGVTYTVQRHEHCVGGGAGTTVLAGEMLWPVLRWLLIYAFDCCYVRLATSNINCVCLRLPSALCVCQSPAGRYGCLQLLSLCSSVTVWRQHNSL